MRRKPVPHEKIEGVCEKLHMLMEWVDDLPVDESEPDSFLKGAIFGYLSSITERLKAETFSKNMTEER